MRLAIKVSAGLAVIACLTGMLMDWLALVLLSITAILGVFLWAAEEHPGRGK
jgi:hypothetical protein